MPANIQINSAIANAGLMAGCLDPTPAASVLAYTYSCTNATMSDGSVAESYLCFPGLVETLEQQLIPERYRCVSKRYYASMILV